MRILHISTRLILGGSQENTVLSCEGQARLGHEVHLAFGPIYGPEGSLLARVEDFNKRCASGEETKRDGGVCRPVGIHVAPHLVRQVAPFKDRWCFRELQRLIDRLRPDIVHTHSSKAGVLGRWAAWSSAPRPGVIHTIHGPPFMPPEGGPPRRLKVHAVNYIYTFAERFAARRCHTIVGVADAMTREFLDRSIGRRSQYVTVRSGMEVEKYLTAPEGEDRATMRRALGVENGDFIIGTVARLTEHKGHDDLLDALGEDLKANPRWKLLWVGDGWWRERLLARARVMGLGVAELDVPQHAAHSSHSDRAGGAPSPSQIIVTGLVPSDRVPAMIRAMDLLAHPSYREGLPRTVPQALLCGVAPVAYDCDGTGEVCADGRTGRLVRTGDRPGLRDAIRWM